MVELVGDDLFKKIIFFFEGVWGLFSNFNIAACSLVLQRPSYNSSFIYGLGSRHCLPSFAPSSRVSFSSSLFSSPAQLGNRGKQLSLMSLLDSTSIFTQQVSCFISSVYSIFSLFFFAILLLSIFSWICHAPIFCYVHGWNWIRSVFSKKRRGIPGTHDV